MNKLQTLKTAPILFLCSMLLSSCATTENYEAKLNTWVVHKSSISDFISVNGYPDSSLEIPNGHKVYIYSSSHILTISDKVVNAWCRTYLETNNKNIIVKWRIEGNNCVADKE